MSIFIISEIGINHNGDIELAKKMIQESKDCGADAVKFQKRDIDIVYDKKLLDSSSDVPASPFHSLFKLKVKAHENHPEGAWIGSNGKVYDINGYLYNPNGPSQSNYSAEEQVNLSYNYICDNIPSSEFYTGTSDFLDASFEVIVEGAKSLIIFIL